MSDSFTNELLSRTNIVDIIGGYLTLRKSGASYIGLCPFHNEKRPHFPLIQLSKFISASVVEKAVMLLLF